MELDDRLQLVAPEGVTIEVVIAGLGSRAAASLLDTLIIGVSFFALTIIDAFVGEVSPGLATALMALTVFMAMFGYFTLFEAFGSGRTPGKRMLGIQVVSVVGGRASFWRIAIRNIVRLIDFIPSGYLVGIISILATGRNQRLGDMAAGTIVVRTVSAADPASARRAPLEASPEHWAAQPSPIPPDVAAMVAGWDLSQVTPQDVAAVRSFLDRRWSLPLQARHNLALEFATRLHPRVQGPPTDQGPERFLEWIVYVKQARG